jgi:cytochrome c-type biogenesis protein CcmH
MRSFLTLLLLLAGLSSFGVHAKEAAPLAEDPVIEKRMEVLAENLRCLVCQNETLAASQADLAKDLRNEIREMMKAGKSDQEIKDYLVNRYGDFVLYKPPVKPTTWLLWFGPFLFLVAGVVVLILYLRRRSHRVVESHLTEEERTRAEALLDDKGAKV